MKKLFALASVSAALTGCIISPQQSSVINVNEPIVVSGVVRNRTLPIVILCEPDNIADSPIYTKVMPSQTPTMDRYGRKVYTFSATVDVPDVCKFQIPVGMQGYQYRSVHLDISQELTDENGATYLRHWAIVPLNPALAECSSKQWSASQSFVDIVANCAPLVPDNYRGNLFVRSDIEAPSTPLAVK